MQLNPRSVLVLNKVMVSYTSLMKAVELIKAPDKVSSQGASAQASVAAPSSESANNNSKMNPVTRDPPAALLLLAEDHAVL